MPRVKIKGPEPKERILAAARKLFFKHGFDPVSTDMIAKEARVSKTTLYSHVGDKQKILIATVQKESERFFDPEFMPPENFEDYRQALIDFGVNLLSLLNEKDIRRFDQVMLSQAIKAPQISMSFYEYAYEATHHHMTRMIKFGQDKGYIKRKDDPSFLCEILCHSTIGDPYQKGLYGFKESTYTDPEKRVQAVLKIILEI